MTPGGITTPVARVGAAPKTGCTVSPDGEHNTNTLIDMFCMMLNITRIHKLNLVNEFISWWWKKSEQRSNAKYQNFKQIRITNESDYRTYLSNHIVFKQEKSILWTIISPWQKVIKNKSSTAIIIIRLI